MGHTELVQWVLGCVKAWVQNLMEIGIKNLVYMVPYHDTITMKFIGLM